MTVSPPRPLGRRGFRISVFVLSLEVSVEQPRTIVIAEKAGDTRDTGTPLLNGGMTKLPKSNLDL